MPTGVTNLTSYPQGFASGLVLRGLPILQTHPGNVFWVSNSPTIERYCVAGSDGGSTSNSNNVGSFQRPFASIKQALSVCTHGAGDIIICKPGHTEYVANNTGLLFNQGGAAIVGLGSGPLRPSITFQTANTANIPVQAANMSIQNFLFKTNFAAVASAFTAVGASVTASIAAGVSGAIQGSVLNVTVVGSGTLYPGAVVNYVAGVIPGTMIVGQLTGTTGGVGTYLLNYNYATAVASTTLTTGTPDFNIESCEFRDLSSALNLVTVFTGSSVANGADGLRFVNNRINSLGTTAASTAIKFSAVQDRVVVTDNWYLGAAVNSTAALVAAGSSNLTNFELARNKVARPNTTQTTSGLLVSTTGASCTGHAYDNYVESLASTTTTVPVINASSGLFFTQNFGARTSGADASGVLIPAAN